MILQIIFSKFKNYFIVPSYAHPHGRKSDGYDPLLPPEFYPTYVYVSH